MRTCGGEDASDDAAQTYQKLPERHVLLAHFDHQRADVILHEDPRDAVAARRVVDGAFLRASHTHAQEHPHNERTHIHTQESTQAH